uniref:DUF7779 domain-containing protein n=1 Tax=Branchiostoma floridae TaxID=7739 RepID=C3YCP0_BRAFL|eukprot:XP_002605831.1 hypothetical protein BRAFLDRAFT_84316 [Branchiostoma floridae]
MDPLHRQVILDCYDDIARDMDPVQALRYSTVHWRDGDPGFIRAKARTEGPHCGARALLDKLLDTSFMVVFPRRMKNFVGREDVFGKIDACLKQNRTCLIRGLGGVGKTSLAIEYGHRRAERYPGGVFWVRLASKGDLCASISHYSSYVSLTREESVHSSDEMSCKSVTMQFRKYLTKSRYWLLVVDGAVRETMKELESLLPHSITETRHILLTSQENLRLDKERISVVSLPPFSDTEAQALFNKTVRSSGEDDRRWVESLGRSLGHHPLALQLAYAYIETTGCSIKEYYDKYTRANAAKKVDLLDKMDIEQVANRNIRQTLDCTLRQLSPSASVLLNMTSFMSPDCIPCPKPYNENFAKLLNTSMRLDKLDMMEMVANLERFSLASRCHAFQPCAFSVHRIVQEVVVAELNESLRLAHLEKAFKYSTMLLSNDTSRVQAEILNNHLHYLALNIDKYQTNLSINDILPLHGHLYVY